MLRKLKAIHLIPAMERAAGEELNMVLVLGSYALGKLMRIPSIR